MKKNIISGELREIALRTIKRKVSNSPLKKQSIYEIFDISMRSSFNESTMRSSELEELEDHDYDYNYEHNFLNDDNFWEQSLISQGQFGYKSTDYDLLIDKLNKECLSKSIKNTVRLISEINIFISHLDHNNIFYDFKLNCLNGYKKNLIMKIL